MLSCARRYFLGTASSRPHPRRQYEHDCFHDGKRQGVMIGALLTAYDALVLHAGHAVVSVLALGGHRRLAFRRSMRAMTAFFAFAAILHTFLIFPLLLPVETGVDRYHSIVI